MPYYAFNDETDMLELAIEVAKDVARYAIELRKEPKFWLFEGAIGVVGDNEDGDVLFYGSNTKEVLKEFKKDYPNKEYPETDITEDDLQEV